MTSQDLPHSVTTKDVIEHVELRALRRLRAARRWWISGMIAFATLTATATGLIMNWRHGRADDLELEGRIKHDAASRETPSIVLVDTTVILDTLKLGDSRAIQLGPDGSRSFRVQLSDANPTLQIDATGVGSFDPTISLFRIPANRTARPSELGFNDDVGDGRDSRLIVMLQATPEFEYELRVQELLGRPGIVTVSLKEYQPPTANEGT